MSISVHPLVPAERARIEIRVVNSRFIATIDRAASVDAARSIVAGMRAEMPDASHHVYAYIIGHGASIIQGMSDDGEPSGTAGRPVLAVLRGSGLGDAVLVVTRYFGGTLLGTGGLVHAYGDAAKAVLEIAPRAEKIARSRLLFAIPYHAYEPVRRLALAHIATIDTEEFGVDITLTVTMPTGQVLAFREALREMLAGSVDVIEEPLE